MIPDGTAVEGATAAPAGAAVALAVTRLTVTRFRSYAQARLDIPPLPVALTGPNGAGKTNILEAVSFLAPGRGLRGARLAEVERVTPAGACAPEGWEGQGAGWAVAATLRTPSGQVEIGTGREPGPTHGGDEGRDRRLVRIDGAAARSQVALAEHVACVWLTPAMDRLFTEGAAGRRRFLDRLVFAFDPAHAGRLNRYEQALRQRGRLLRDGGGDAAWFAVLEEEMATNGVAVAAARRTMVERLALACRHASISSSSGGESSGPGPFPVPGLAMAGTLDGWLAERPALDVEDAMRRALAEGRRDDRHGGSAGVGPHRSDFAVTDLAKGMAAEHASTGEQKALLVAIVLAHARLMAAETGRAPLLLLDEVAAHLDAGRRSALFAAVRATGAQAWMTGTDAATFAEWGAGAAQVHVADGRLTVLSG